SWPRLSSPALRNLANSTTPAMLNSSPASESKSANKASSASRATYALAASRAATSTKHCRIPLTQKKKPPMFASASNASSALSVPKSRKRNSHPSTAPFSLPAFPQPSSAANSNPSPAKTSRKPTLKNKYSNDLDILIARTSSPPSTFFRFPVHNLLHQNCISQVNGKLLRPVLKSSI